MKRVEKDEDWTLMCPNECPGLFDCWGEKFEELYLKYEKEGKGRKTIQARELWDKILESQIETGDSPKKRGGNKNKLSKEKYSEGKTMNHRGVRAF